MAKNVEQKLPILATEHSSIIWKMCTFHKTKVMLTQPTSLLCLGNRKGRFVTNTFESKAAQDVRLYIRTNSLKGGGAR